MGYTDSGEVYALESLFPRGFIDEWRLPCVVDVGVSLAAVCVRLRHDEALATGCKEKDSQELSRKTHIPVYEKRSKSRQYCNIVEIDRLGRRERALARDPRDYGRADRKLGSKSCSMQSRHQLYVRGESNDSLLHEYKALRQTSHSGVDAHEQVVDPES